MKKSIITLCLCTMFSNFTFAQEYKQMKWVLKANFGYSLPVMRFPNGYFTDNMLGSVYDNNIYFQFPAITFFINNNWGIEFSGAAYLSNPTDKYEDKVQLYILNRYPDYSYSKGYNNLNNSKIAMRMGPVYKWEQNRFVFIAGLPLISFMDIETPSLYLKLKRKNSNEMISLRYSKGLYDEYQSASTMYNISPYFTTAYRLTNRILLNMELGINLYKAKFEYIETERNWVTDNIKTTKYPYNKWVGDLNVGIGLLFVLGQKK